MDCIAFHAFVQCFGHMVLCLGFSGTSGHVLDHNHSLCWYRAGRNGKEVSLPFGVSIHHLYLTPYSPSRDLLHSFLPFFRAWLTVALAAC